MLASINPYIRRAWGSKYGLRPGEHLKRIICDYEIVFIRSGQATIIIDGVEYLTKPNDLFIIRPGHLHEFINGDMYLDQPHVHFDLQQFGDADQVPIPMDMKDLTEEARNKIRPDILDDVVPSFPVHVKLHNPRLFESMLANIIYLQEQDQPFNVLLVKSAFMQLFHQLLFEISFSTSQHHDPKQDYAIRIRLYIENNLSRSITLDELSEGVNLSKSYLLDIYKSVYHISPIKYHQMMRINKARYMLRYTQQNVSEIGAALGFQNIHDFSRAFKNTEGVSPTAFREQSAEHTIRTKRHIRTE